MKLPYRQMTCDQRGYTLLELSIVLIIVGLLAGGIMVGNELIHSAELRSVVTDYEAYTSAVSNFRQKYRALPGDMRDAVNYWGMAEDGGGTPAADDAACAALSNPAEDRKTCNGNGNGHVGAYDDPAEAYERFRFWHHLYNSQLIPTLFTGVAGGAGSEEAVVEENIPASKLPGVGWGIFWLGLYESGAMWFDGDHRNAFILGKAQDGVDAPNYAGGLTVQDAWDVDLKIDDGKPAQGIITVRYNGVSATCHTASATNDWDAEYDLNASGDCTLLIRSGF